MRILVRIVAVPIPGLGGRDRGGMVCQKRLFFLSIVGSLLLLVFLRPYVKAIGDASAFAIELTRLTGREMQPWRRTTELSQLGMALNRAARELYRHDDLRTRMENDLRASQHAYHTDREYPWNYLSTLYQCGPQAAVDEQYVRNPNRIAGDELLRQVGMLLQENVRQRDTIARLGGDEFGLLMEQ